MGPKNSKERSPDCERQGTKVKVSANDFDTVCSIGEGNFARVMLVKKKDTGEFFAMKILKKEALIQKDEVEHTRTERQILESASHPFLAKMRWAFQTQDALYLVMNFANGGELFSHLKREKRFSEDRARFYAAEICMGLEYLHDGGIVYRDLKPENVLLDCEGHIVLTDFGLSKIMRGGLDKTKTFCGTPEYLAPEILLNKGHGKPVDWWSFGTLLYEMIVGIPPFFSHDVHEMYEMILHTELYIPEFVGLDAADLLSRLLIRDPTKRLGSGPNGAREVKAHPFFRSVDWVALYNRRIVPPFKPVVSGPGDTSNVDPEFTQKKVATDTPKDNAPLGSREQRFFEGFTYDNTPGMRCENSPPLRKSSPANGGGSPL
eukprot:TRINITY_DN6997_c0_g1_i2.p1 TRINITY_DN6997_c0_g1~~TRINITY_DN6997_c0_g1_i2.p1  ORF type:complete len:375 (+),score=89.09 TRINITY_DN6997_c0_g1_i2:337-1461(+)